MNNYRVHVLTNGLVIINVVIFAFLFTANIRLCVPDDLKSDCQTMANLFPGLIVCISAKDK